MSVREKKIFQAGKKFYYEKCSPRSGIATQKFSAKNDNGKPTQFDLKVPISPFFVPRLRPTNQSDGSANLIKRCTIFCCLSGSPIDCAMTTWGHARAEFQKCSPESWDPGYITNSLGLSRCVGGQKLA